LGDRSKEVPRPNPIIVEERDRQTDRNRDTERQREREFGEEKYI